MKIWLWTMDRQNYGSNQNTTKYIEYYQKNTNLKKKKNENDSTPGQSKKKQLNKIK